MRLAGVRLRTERRRWAGTALLGGQVRRTWVITLHTDDGRVAEGEIAWLPRGGPEPDVANLVASWAWGWLGRSLPSPRVDPGLPPCVAWAITAALADLHAHWSAPGSLAENGLLVAGEGTPAEVAATWSATMAAHPGIRVWKVKVGRTTLDVDLARLRALDLPDGVALRLDPNRAWGEHDPAHVAAELRGLPIAYVEEPVGWPELADWAATGLPCAADESVLEVDVEALADAGIAALVLKPSVLGGLGEVQTVVEAATARGLDVVVSSSLEGPVGRRHLASLVGTLPVPRAAAGLARDVLVEPPDAVEVATWDLDTDPLADAADWYPDAIGLESMDGDLTCISFAEWHARADERARSLGDRRGERLAVTIDGPEDAITLFAVLRSGAVACLVPPGPAGDEAREQHRIAEPAPSDGTPPGVQHGAVATLLWSSGSQGRPRALAHTLGQHLASAAAAHDRSPFAVGDRWLVALRMHHVGGLALLFRALHRGGTVVWPGDRSLDVVAPTHISWVPTQLRRAPRIPPPGVRHVLIGGAACPPTLVAARRADGWPIQTTYGSTETASQVCTSSPTDDPASSGCPLPGVVVSATPDLLVRGPTVTLGTYDDGRVTPLREDGALPTGDVADLDGDLLYVRGRSDTMFVSGGENVYPETIERVLGALPDVEAVVVVDVPDDEWGARPWAFVDGDLDLETARSVLAGRLPKHARVDRVLPWEAEGVGATGKPRRGWFRERARAIRCGDGPGSR